MCRVVFLLVAAAGVSSASERSAQGRAEEISWRRVVYLGGVPGVRVERTDFRQTLTLTPSELIVRVEPPPITDSSAGPKKASRVLFAIRRESVVAVTYEGFRHDMPTAQAWIGIRGRWPKATDHLIIIDYRLPDGTEPEVLLRVDQKDHQEIVDILRTMPAVPGTPAATR